MKISTRGRYSLEALLFLSLLPDGEYASTRTISEKTGISDGYLEQLFISLKHDGLVRGIRGAQGGYLLAKDANEITIGQILRSVEGSSDPVACVSGGVCESESLCRTRKIWVSLAAEINECLEGILLSDLSGFCRDHGSGEYAI